MTPAEPAEEAVAWVVGGGGLLGSSLLAAARTQGRTVHRSQVPWHDAAASVDVLAADAERLIAGHRVVELYWCAGAGVVATTPEQLASEVELVDRFVDAVSEVRRRHLGQTLRVFLSSSAGGVYAGSGHAPFTERTEPVPISPYGEAKLAVERAVARLAEGGTSVLVGRIANLYGPGQNLEKPQGVITQMCRAHLRRAPLSIYVSLDTARDYLFVRDAAQMALAGLSRLAEEPPGTVVTKILASHVPTTLASVVGEVRRISKRRPPLVLGTSPNARFQTRDLRFRSVVWPELDGLASTPLPAGIAATLEDVARSERAGVRAR